MQLVTIFKGYLPFEVDIVLLAMALVYIFPQLVLGCLDLLYGN